jgi:acetyltransferase-like isoleucine patch superfamily enzyme
LAGPGLVDVFIHPRAQVEDGVELGAGCKVWQLTHVRGGARLGPGCKIGSAVYVGAGVRLGANCKVQNQALLYEGVELEDGVFVGPGVCFTNDRFPRAVNPDGSLKDDSDWELGRILVREGAAIGAGAVVVTGCTIGRWALVGAASLVTRDVPDHALVYGNPARVAGWVCRCARRLDLRQGTGGAVEGWCATCGVATPLPDARMPGGLNGSA